MRAAPPAPDEILGLDVPDGHYTITAERHAGLLRHVHTPPELFPTVVGGPAHPIFAHLSTNRGMGWDFPELLDHVGATTTDGVVFGGGTFTFTRLPTVGEPYTIRARVHDVRRKHGRRIGAFDAITLALDVVAPDGSVPVRTTETYVVPRPGLGGATSPPPAAAPPAPPPGRLRRPVGPIAREDIAGIMAVMEDTNPVHLDAGLAHAAGYRGPVHQGPANLAFVLDAIAADRGSVADIGHVAFTFRDTVTEGDRLEVHLDGAGPVAGRLEIVGVGTALTCEVGFR